MKVNQTFEYLRSIHPIEIGDRAGNKKVVSTYWKYFNNNNHPYVKLCDGGQYAEITALEFFKLKKRN